MSQTSTINRKNLSLITEIPSEKISVTSNPKPLTSEQQTSLDWSGRLADLCSSMGQSLAKLALEIPEFQEKDLNDYETLVFSQILRSLEKEFKLNKMVDTQG